MQTLCVLSDDAGKLGRLRRALTGAFNLQMLEPDRFRDSDPGPYTVVDVSLRENSQLADLRNWLKRKPKDGRAIFVIDKSARIEVTQAYAIGATDVVHRPVDANDVMRICFGEFLALAGDASTFPVHDAPGVAAAVDTLQSTFSAVSAGGPVDVAAIDTAGDAIVGQMSSQGLSAWIETVRKHHSQTYQHCMLVTGVAVAFGQNIGLSHRDRKRLSLAGMLHDVGKAKIPLAILEKPGPLNPEEMGVMRQHPELGADTLGPDSNLEPEMVDMVLHHHEYLDGSGYPHGLHASEIRDLVRIMTISDIFGALIERRSYKPPLSNDAAYQILLDMGQRLDQDLVRAFSSTAKMNLQRNFA